MILQDILETLDSWKSELKSCDRIFIRSPTSNRSLFFTCYGNNKFPSLSKNDPRIRQIPFETRRPTFKEVQSVHHKLSTLWNHGECLIIFNTIFTQMM